LLDQPLNGLNLIREAGLNVLEPRGRREIIAVEEKRSHISHEHMSFKQEVVRLCQLGFGKQRLSASGRHASSIVQRIMNSFTCAVYSTLAAEKNPSLRKQRKRRRMARGARVDEIGEAFWRRMY
jgi:hypothetical protein